MHCVVLIVTTLIPAASPSVQELLDQAVQTGTEKAVLPEGRVEVKGKLRVRGAKDLVIDGAATTLVFSDREGTTWSFDSCRNITLRGFTIDYDPLPFIQARITGRTEDGKRFDFTVCDGYPGLRAEDSKHYRQAYIFEPDQPRWKPWVSIGGSWRQGLTTSPAHRHENVPDATSMRSWFPDCTISAPTICRMSPGNMSNFLAISLSMLPKAKQHMTGSQVPWERSTGAAETAYRRHHQGQATRSVPGGLRAGVRFGGRQVGPCLG